MKTRGGRREGEASGSARERRLEGGERGRNATRAKSKEVVDDSNLS